MLFWRTNALTPAARPPLAPRQAAMCSISTFFSRGKLTATSILQKRGSNLTKHTQHFLTTIYIILIKKIITLETSTIGDFRSSKENKKVIRPRK